MSVLTQLTSLVRRGKKRRGKGYSSGKGGHTSGRGHKGTKARLKVKIIETGTKHKKSLWQRLPTLRGKKKSLTQKKAVIAVNLDRLIPFITKKGLVIDRKFLVAKKIISPQTKEEVKVVAGTKKLPYKVDFKLNISQTVKEMNDNLKDKKVAKKAKERQ